MALASRMMERIALERYDDQAAAYQPIAAPATVWAAVTPLGQEQYRFAIRWRPDLQSAKDAEPALRVRWKDHILDVVDVTETERAVEVQVLAKGRQIEYDNLATGARRKTSWP
jgi:head-tail adaptor